jgi:hypothetical protein
MDDYLLGEIYYALRAGLTAKGQAEADDALLCAAMRTGGDAGEILRTIAGLSQIDAKPKLQLIHGGDVA